METMISEYISSQDWRKGKSLGIVGNDYYMIYLKGGEIVTLQKGDDIIPERKLLKKAIAIRTWGPFIDNSGGMEELVTRTHYIRTTWEQGKQTERIVRKKAI